MAGKGEISDEELIREIAKILKNADLNVITMKMVRQKLEERFGVDLTEKRLVISKLVKDYMG